MIQLLVILVIGIYVLNLGFGFEGTFTQLKDYSFVSKLFKQMDQAVVVSDNRFRDHWLGSVPIPLPKYYVLGIDVQRNDFESGWHSYLRGELRQGGWWYYYIYGMAIKIPIGVIILILLAVIAVTAKKNVTALINTIILLLPGFILLFFISSQTGFNHHFRYILPVLPAMYIFASQFASFSKSKLMQIVLLFLLSWAFFSSLRYSPHNLSYFNEFAGGPEHGHDHLIDSNIDWGQDLFYLNDWLVSHPEATPLSFAYFGLVDPTSMGIEFSLPRMPKKNERALERPPPGWYAISVSLLRGYPFLAHDGRGGRRQIDLHSFDYFINQIPVARAGYSINIYYLPNDMEKVPIRKSD